MIEILYLVYSLTSFAFCVNISTLETEINFLTDYLKNENNINSVTVLHCWNLEYQIKMSRKFYELNVMTNLKHVTHEKLQIADYPNSLTILDASCPNFIKILSKANSMFLFRRPHKWIILNLVDDKIFENLDSLLDSEVIKISKIGDDQISFEYIYKIDKNASILRTYLGSWKYEHGFINLNKELICRQRRALKGHELKTSLIYTDKNTLNHITDYRDGNIDTILKLNYFLIGYLFEYMNASKKFTFATSWGQQVGKNNFTGLLGQIHRKEIDISSPLFCVVERASIYDCIAMTTPAKGFFIFRQPPLSYVANIFALPFETNLWLTDVAFLISVSVLLYFVIIWEWKVLQKTNSEPETDMITKSWGESLMFTVGAVCQQGYPTEPKSGAGKIIVLTLFLTLLFMFTAYSANTVVLFQSTATHIHTLEDLYNTKMSLGVDDKLYYRDWFSKHLEPIRRKIYLERIVPKGEPEHFYPIREGIERMRNDYFAFHTDEISGYKIIGDTFQEDEKCGLKRITYLYVSNPWLTVPKKSIFKDYFAVGFRMIQERGIQNREIRKLYSQEPKCIAQHSRFRSAGILDLYSVYMIYFFGLATSVALLLTELIWPRIIKLIFHKSNFTVKYE